MPFNRSDPNGVTWNLESYFPQFDGAEYRQYRDGLERELADLQETSSRIGSLTSETVPAWTAFLKRLEEAVRACSHLSSYVGCLSAADARNEDIKRESARLSRIGAAFQKAEVPFRAALRQADDMSFEALANEESLRSARYYLEREREDARLSMEPGLELLAADLGVTGIAAWGRLYNNISGKLEFDLNRPDGTIERVPMAQKGSLIDDPDPKVRKAVLHGSNAAWEQVEDSVAACLNGICGTRHILNERRGVKHFLDVAVFQSATTRETVNTMWEAVSARRELPRRFLKRKAELLGLERLGFQDLTAPLPTAGEKRLPWEEGLETVLGTFDAAYPALGHFARDMAKNRRIESEKRAGKRPGAFCTTSYRSLESRVFMTYGGTTGDLQTLAHELGHAYHGYILRDTRPFARMYPMTLAETASTFAEDILARALLASPDVPAPRKAGLLDVRLGHAATFLLNIHMRYLFEERFHVERAEGEVSVPRLKELVLEAERECYGDALDTGQLDPMFWASKLHFYIVGVTFYNFPYTFGYLLSRGLSARFQKEGPEFLPKYEDFLRLTGNATAEDVARRTLGIDLRRPDFWIEAVESHERDLALFEEMTTALGNSKGAVEE